jgi:hypothetical protein
MSTLSIAGKPLIFHLEEWAEDISTSSFVADFILGMRLPSIGVSTSIKFLPDDEVVA